MKRTWFYLKASLWFIPSVIVVASIALAVALIWADALIDRSIMSSIPWFFGAEAPASRDALAVIAGSMITVAGIVFSITIVALTLASTQFSPRILRNFMRDRTTQVQLGVFVGIFVYCLVVLRAVREGDSPFVPSLAVGTGVALGIFGMGFLVYFIHHIASSIQASNIIASIARDTIHAVDKLYPRVEDAPPVDEAAAGAALEGLDWRPVASRGTGYLQSVDTGGLLDLARARGATVRLEHRVGEFVIEGMLLASIAFDDPRARVEEADERAVNDLCDLGPNRTLEQDVAFGLRQMVDVSLKALSPSINDTTTALTCIDYLGAILVHLVRRRVGNFYEFDDGQPRIILPAQTIEDFLDLAFNQIRQNGSGNVAVILRMLGSLGNVERAALHTLNEGECESLVVPQVRMLADLAERTVTAEDDRLAIRRRVDEFRGVDAAPTR